jgi:hypothetical protein
MLHALSDKLGASAFQQATATGRTMTRDEAIDAALAAQPVHALPADISE